MSYIGLFGGSTVFQVFTGLWPEKWTLNKVTKLKLKQTTVKWYHFMSFQSLVCMHQYGCNHFLGQKNMLVVLLVVCHIKKKQLWFFLHFFLLFHIFLHFTVAEWADLLFRYIEKRSVWLVCYFQYRQQL